MAIEDIRWESSLEEDRTRGFSVIWDMVRTCLTAYKTQGEVVQGARFRSYAGMLYRLFFEELPADSDYESQLQRCNQTMANIAFDALKSTPARVSYFDRSFPRQYRMFMEELNTFPIDVHADRAEILNVIEYTTGQMFESREAFCLNKEQK